MGFLLAYAVGIASMLAGAAVVHNIYKPNLVLPTTQNTTLPTPTTQNEKKDI